MPNHGARTLRRTLASTPWLLLLAGLSCKYNVTLPWEVPLDGSAREPDVFDQASSSSPDTSLSGPDARACPGIFNRWTMNRAPSPIIVAIDRSTSMQSSFDSTTKMLAASLAVDYQVDRHPGIQFSTIWFPWACGGAACCASQGINASSRKPTSDASGGCGLFDAGCLPPSNDSPSHDALQQARSNISKDYSGRWYSTVVLITDQTPNCSGGSPSDYACDSAVNEAGKLAYDLYVRTFVMVPSTDGRPTPNCLTRIASKNAHNFSDAQQLIEAKGSREMRDRLDQIANGIEEKICRFYLVGTYADPSQIEWVEIAGTRIERETGWNPVAGTILLTPDVCKTIAKTANPDVAAFICNSNNGQGGPFGGPQGP